MSALSQECGSDSYWTGCKSESCANPASQPYPTLPWMEAAPRAVREISLSWAWRPGSPRPMFACHSQCWSLRPAGGCHILWFLCKDAARSGYAVVLDSAWEGLRHSCVCLSSVFVSGCVCVFVWAGSVFVDLIVCVGVWGSGVGKDCFVWEQCLPLAKYL